MRSCAKPAERQALASRDGVSRGSAFSAPLLVALRALGAAALLLLCGCSSNQAHLAVASARIEPRGGATALVVDCDWKPSEAMLEALDHGIALGLRLRLYREQPGLIGWRRVASIERHVDLRYYPLTRRYQLRDLDIGTVQSFGVRAAALAALSRLELPLRGGAMAAQAGERHRLRIELDTSALPGALRLPALISPAWRQDDVELKWSATGAG
ncbi:DUF4390 domain-containing protein [Tahibacter amnicola]|uniref:DUF4390 domain-containing protein n=1 Tax=Tahibacter amnicola TaxID=2976241 RepID=A0ABY6BD86_9GAMM|nr:DUF4390 domain-containing protein [Tahibacter amnicola]UXI67814.1 DUF4390 domain-containing protein [Tahibacter amnicola]